jgi:hypothetical protein
MASGIRNQQAIIANVRNDWATIRIHDNVAGSYSITDILRVP